MILMGLAIAIILAALITALGFMRDENWILKASQATGVFFAIYGIYQIFSGLSLINNNQEGVVLAGVVYSIIGLAVFGLGAKFTSSPKPLPRQTNK
jgi:hypothetical protein